MNMRLWRRAGVFLGVSVVIAVSLCPGLAAEEEKRKATVPSVEQFEARMKVYMRGWLEDMAESYAEKELGEKSEEERKKAAEEIVTRCIEALEKELESKEFAFITWEGRRLRDYKRESARREILKAAMSSRSTAEAWVFELEFLCEADAISFAGMEDVEPFLEFLMELPNARAAEGKALAAKDYVFACILLGQQAKKGWGILEKLAYPLATPPPETESHRLSRELGKKAREVLTKHPKSFRRLSEKTEAELIGRYGDALVFSEEDSAKAMERMEAKETDGASKWKAERYVRLTNVSGIVPPEVSLLPGLREILTKEHAEGKLLSDGAGLELVTRELWLEATGLRNGRRVALEMTAEKAFPELAEKKPGKPGEEKQAMSAREAELEQKKTASKNQMKQLGLAMHIYSTDYKEKFPESLAELFAEGKMYLTNKELAFSPATGRGYTYLSISTGAASHPGWMVVWESVPIEDGTRLALFVDGHVETMTEDKFVRKLEVQVEEMAKKGLEVELIEGE